LFGEQKRSSPFTWSVCNDRFGLQGRLSSFENL